MDNTSKIYKNLSLIIDYIKPLCVKVPCNEKIEIWIPNTDASLRISGGLRGHFACDVSVEDRRFFTYQYYNEFTKDSDPNGHAIGYEDGAHCNSFRPIRELDMSIAKSLILNWKSIKEEILEKISGFENESKELDEFEL